MEEKNLILESPPEYVKASTPCMAHEPVKTFVGREKDLEELHRIITERRAGVITGMAVTEGIGKTELARMYAKEYRTEFSGGIFWASLKGSTWQEEAERIFKALYPGTAITQFLDNTKAKDAICNHLNRKNTLLVIDNVNEADEIIRPGCAVLLTTSEKSAFGVISRMAIKELDRLSYDDGMKLLAKISGNTRVAQDPAGASGIVENIGGIPLALDIAARHLEAVPDLDFHDYIDQIHSKFDELKLKDNENKEVTVALELSLKQLESVPHGAAYIALFEAAGVCAESGFASLTLIETAGVSAIDQGIVQELHRRSLLEFDPESLRYSMHPLLRQLSKERLKMDETRELFYRENYCMHFLHFAQVYINSPDMLISEKDGLWQAITHARQTDKIKGLFPVLIDFLIQPTLQLAAGNDYEGAFQYLVSIGMININNPEVLTDRASILHVLAENQTGLQEPSLACVFTNLGSIYIYLGEYYKAIDFYGKALEIHNHMRDLQGEGDDLGSIGSAYEGLGKQLKAISFFEKQLEVTRKTGDARGEGNTLGKLGNAYADIGEFRKAISFYEKQLEIVRRSGDARGEGDVLANMGLAYTDLGEYHRAIGFFEKQLEITRRIGDARGEGNALNSSGIAWAELREYHRAISFYERALEAYNGAGELRGEGNALANMGIAYAKMGAQERAYKCFGASKTIFLGLGLNNIVTQIDEMIRSTEYWLLRSGIYVHGRLTENKRGVFKKLQPVNK